MIDFSREAGLLTMFLVVAATEIELRPLLALCPAGLEMTPLVSGVGPLEAAIRLTRKLERLHRQVHGVVNFGIAGAYLPERGEEGARILDICLAEREVLGDFGVCFAGAVEPFDDPKLGGEREFFLDGALLAHARRVLAAAGLAYRHGTFVTVAAASGTTVRGRRLQSRYRALCENMEGAALARVCREFALPMLEIRAISNMVEDRPGGNWEIEKACSRASEAVALLVDDLRESR